MARSQRNRILVAALAGLLTLAAAAVAAVPAAAATAATSPGKPSATTATAWQQACAPAHGHLATCFATYRRARATGLAPNAAVSSPTLRPVDIAAAYKLPASTTAHPTVAIVDAQDNPKAESDLAYYRAKFKLAPCTTANGCFRKVNQSGQITPLPDPDPGWGVEIALDLDAVSAACPSCHILLVEGNSPSFDDLGISVNTAVRLGAAVVSNSYGATEFNGIATFGRKYYVHPGVPVVASSGDAGFGIPQFPAVLKTTIAVGGTSLTRATGKARGWTEQAWGGAGSGCSAYIAKPSWQHDTHCPGRTVADVSAVADPQSGFMIYDTFGLGSDNGLLQVGGTSLSSPLVAAMIARAGHAASYSDARGIYTRAGYGGSRAARIGVTARTGSFFDVVGGSNGFCGGDYLCTGLAGYDAPTGVGSPNGLGGL